MCLLFRTCGDFMKLTKGVCEKCCKLRGQWSRMDEKWWEEGRVLCPAKLYEGKTACQQINKEPLNTCPYYLEHVVNGD